MCVRDVLQAVRAEPGVYMNKLIIERATTRDAGKYICFGSSTGRGYNTKDAYLTVLGGKSRHVTPPPSLCF